MTDLISRADAIRWVKTECNPYGKPTLDYDSGLKFIKHLKKMPSELPSAGADGANLINRHDAVTVIREECWKCNNMINDDLFMRIMSLPTSRQTDCTEFIEWLVDRVLDETIWENNSVAYGEIICRKLEKLGVLEVTEEPSYYIRPSADAVHGEWIKKQVFNPEIDKYVPLIECSVCGYEPYFGGSESKFNYCANCGAIMKGGAE